MAAAAKVDPISHATEIRDFRRATVFVLAIAAILLGLGGALEEPRLLELSVALGILAGAFRLLIELFPGMRPRIATLHPSHFFLDTWRELDEEAARERDDRKATGRYDYRPMIALCFGAVCLAIMEYFGHATNFHEALDVLDPPGRIGPAVTLAERLADSQFVELGEFAWWSAFRVLGYFLLPALLVRYGFKERIRDSGLETKGFREHAWIYGLAYVVVLVCVVFLARNDAHFQSYYPFYHQANRSWLDFGAWEVLYAAQFFSLEFFFRGFWLKAMKRSLGSYAIFAMVVPYCMIHFGKPFVETMAAIFAGLVLGTLSMKTRSIWSGFLIHVSVAISMDLAALAASGGWPVDLWPPGW
jgi:membrane protease YdiL (CAAX protease family)